MDVYINDVATTSNIPIKTLLKNCWKLIIYKEKLNQRIKRLTQRNTDFDWLFVTCISNNHNGVFV